MIWISTLCLLALAAWLFLNALNERRWVQAHSHDESVASDEGLLPNFTSSTRSGVLGKMSIDQEDGLFASAVTRVQEKTARYGERFFETKAAAARLGDDEPRPQSVKEENSLFGRAVARIGNSVEQMDLKLDQKIKAASSQTTFLNSSGDEESVVARASRKVARSSEVMSLRVANYARGIGRNASGKAGVFGQMASKVTGNRQNSNAGNASVDDEDLVTRVASKVSSSIDRLDEKMSSAGNRINEMDEKIVSASKNAVGKLDK